MPKDVTRRGFLRGSVLVGVGVGMSAPALAEDADDDASEAGPAPAETVALSTRVNGETVTADVHADTSACDLIRHDLGLTGTKRSCGHGACGACAVYLDGTPVSSCVLPAIALQGRTVRTIEDLGAEGLHPVQRAFMAEDALQCGFCTPGFVMEAAAFHDAWRAERGTARPSRDEVADALAGHLCRCGAYPAIYRAVQAACSGDYDGTDPVEPARPDALEKVTGAARYTVDVQLEGMLYAAVLRSPHAHARIRSIDIVPASALPGIEAAIVLIEPDHYVRFVGQEIAAVAAPDLRTAREALSRIAVDYEVLPAVADTYAALAEGAPEVFRKHRKEAPSGNEFDLPVMRWRKNVRGPFHTSKLMRVPAAERGVERAREGEGHLAEDVWHVQVQQHTALEPHAAVAHLEGDTLRLHTSTQACSDLAEDLAKHTKRKPEAVRVLCAYVGGAFGAKATFQMEHRIACALALQAGKPVRVVYDRAEEMLVGGQRPGVRLELAVAADPEGSLGGMVLHAYNDGGVSISNAVGLNYRTTYRINGKKKLRDYDVLTNTPPGKPFRGPGGPNGLWGLEQAIDRLAFMRAEDPIVLRRRWDPHPVRERLYAWALGLRAWQERGPPGAQEGRLRRGVGVAVGAWPYLLSPGSEVQIVARPDGSISASSATQDVGNGTRGVIAATVAAELNIAIGDVKVEIGDSRLVYGPLCGGSRVTASLAPACKDAVRQLKEVLVKVAQSAMGLDGAYADDEGVKHRGEVTPWRDVLARSGSPITVVGRRERDEGGYLIPLTIERLRVGRGQGSALMVAEVEVDTWTGKVRVERVHAGIGVGRIVSRIGAASQIEGAVVQGVGYALYEERRVCPNTASQLTLNLEDYRICGIGDAPEVEIHFDQGGFDHVPTHGIGLAEVATIPVAAAIGNAVAHATGHRFHSMPLRPSRIVTELEAT